MDYAKLIDVNLKRAFSNLKRGKIATEATFHKASTSFNFGTGNATETPGDSVTVSIIVTNTKKPSSNRNTVVKTIMALSEEVGDLKLYEKVNHEGFEWKISSILRDSGFVSMCELSREA
jgi:hypothetical protein